MARQGHDPPKKKARKENVAQSNRPKPISSSDSSFSSSFSAFFSSSAGASGAAPPPLAAPAGAAAAPPPDPTFSSISLTFFPSSACTTCQSLSSLHDMPNVRMEYVHLCKEGGPYRFDILDTGGFDKSIEFVGLKLSQRLPTPQQLSAPTVMSRSSSARMRAAYEAASSE